MRTFLIILAAAVLVFALARIVGRLLPHPGDDDGPDLP